MKRLIQFVLFVLAQNLSSACNLPKTREPIPEPMSHDAELDSNNRYSNVSRIESKTETNRVESKKCSDPRIPIPNFDKEPLTTVIISRGKKQVILRGNKLLLNGRLQRTPIKITWSQESLKQKGKAYPNGSEITGEGNITIDKLGSFPGSIILYHHKSYIAIVNEVPLERYVQSVVENEMPALWLKEAKKAQAVAARTYALARMAQNEGNYALEASVLDQVYRGGLGNDSVAEAVRETSGEILVQNNGLIEAKYHSTCGGHTENPDEVWPGLNMGRQWSVTCKTCGKSPFFRWTTILSQGKLTTALRKIESKIKRVSSLKVTQRSVSNRAVTIEVNTGEGNYTLSGRDFRRALSYRKVRSTNFKILNYRNKQIKLEGFGFGHGVGMCQWGAQGMAQLGFKYASILKHYYRGSKLHNAYEL